MSDAPVTPSTPSIDSAVAEATGNTQATQEAVAIEGGEPTQLDQVATAAEKALAKKFKVKIENQESEVDEAELVAGYQRAKASAKKFNEAAQIKKQAEQLVGRLQSDPIAVLKELGVDVRSMSESLIAKEFAEEDPTLSEGDRKLLAAEKELKQYKEKERLAKEEQERKDHASLIEKYQAEYEGNIQSALAKSGLPKTPFTVKRMAQYMARALDNGYELSPTDVVAYVKEDYINDMKALLSQADGDALTSLLGKDVTDKIRKTELAKAKAKTVPNPTSTKQVASNTEAKPAEKKKMTMAEFREFVNKG